MSVNMYMHSYVYMYIIYITHMHNLTRRMFITILNLYALNNMALQYISQNLIELQKEIAKSPIIVEDFSSLSQ